MIAFVGLGNIGIKYGKTKHNAGFWIIEEWAKRHNLEFKPGNGEYVFAKSKKWKVILVKPVTGMNNSGTAIKEVVKSWDLADSEILIVTDDVDLPLGSIRIKPKGGDGCHRGLENIIYHLNSNQFPRLKFGIGTKENMRPAEKYVLKPFKRENYKEVEIAINKAVDALDSILVNGLSYTMNYFN
jgi:PTH1 family peptidyl-tRNA hydrolase